MNSTLSAHEIDSILEDWSMRFPDGQYSENDPNRFYYLRESLQSLNYDQPAINKVVESLSGHSLDTKLDTLDATKTEQLFVNMINLLVEHPKAVTMSSEEIYHLLEHSTITTGTATPEIQSKKIRDAIVVAKHDFETKLKQLTDTRAEFIALAKPEKFLLPLDDIDRVDWKTVLNAKLAVAKLLTAANKAKIAKLEAVIHNYKEAKETYFKTKNSVELGHFIKKFTDGSIRVNSKMDALDEGLLTEGITHLNLSQILINLHENLQYQKLLGQPAISTGQGKYATSKFWNRLTKKSADIPKSDILIGTNGVSVKGTAYQLMSGSPEEARATLFAALDHIGRDTIKSITQKALTELEDDFKYLSTSDVANVRTKNVKLDQSTVDYIHTLNGQLQKTIGFELSHFADEKPERTFYSKFTYFRTIINALAHKDSGISDRPEHGTGNMFIANTDNVNNILRRIIEPMETLKSFSGKTLKSPKGVPVVVIKKLRSVLVLDFFRGANQIDVVIDFDKLHELQKIVGTAEVNTVSGDTTDNQRVADIFEHINDIQQRMIVDIKALVSDDKFAYEFAKECAGGFRKFDHADGGNSDGRADLVLIWNSTYNTKMRNLSGPDGEKTLKKLAGSLQVRLGAKSASYPNPKNKLGYVVRQVLRADIKDTKFEKEKITVNEYLRERNNTEDTTRADGLDADFNPYSIKNIFGDFDNQVTELFQEWPENGVSLNESLGDYIEKNSSWMKERIVALLDWLKEKLVAVFHYINDSVANFFEVFEIEVSDIHLSTAPMEVLFQ